MGAGSHDAACTTADFSSKLTSTSFTPVTFISASCTRRVQEPFQVIPWMARVTAHSPPGTAAAGDAEGEAAVAPGRG